MHITSLIIWFKRLIYRNKVRHFHEIIQRNVKAELDEFMVLLHEIRDFLYNDELEDSVLYTISEYPEVMVWSMLESADKDYSIRHKYYFEYKETLKELMDDTETSLLIGFGKNLIDVIHTYTRLYIDGYHEFLPQIRSLGETYLHMRSIKNIDIDAELNKARAFYF